MNRVWLAIAMMELAILPILSSAQADDLGALRGRTIRVVISTPVGGSNDRYARLFGEALERLLPESAVRIQNIDGAGGTLGAREIADAGGSLITIGLLHTGPIYKQLTADEALPYDLLRFHWLGALGANQRFLGVRKALAPFEIGAVNPAKKRLIMLTRTAGSPAYVDGVLINAITPIHMKIVTGFKEEEQDSLFLAGEADVVLASFESSHELVESGDLVPVFRFGNQETPEALKSVPDLASIVHPGTPSDVLAVIQQLNDTGRFVVAAPATNADTVTALRAAFDLIVADKVYIEAIANAKLVHSPVQGVVVEENFRKLFSAGNDVSRTLKAYLRCGQEISEEKTENCH